MRYDLRGRDVMYVDDGPWRVDDARPRRCAHHCCEGHEHALMRRRDSMNGNQSCHNFNEGDGASKADCQTPAILGEH